MNKNKCVCERERAVYKNDNDRINACCTAAAAACLIVFVISFQTRL